MQPIYNDMLPARVQVGSRASARVRTRVLNCVWDRVWDHAWIRVIVSARTRVQDGMQDKKASL